MLFRIEISPDCGGKRPNNIKVLQGISRPSTGFKAASNFFGAVTTRRTLRHQQNAQAIAAAVDRRL
jgi:hypothetical protein